MGAVRMVARPTAAVVTAAAARRQATVAEAIRRQVTVAEAIPLRAGDRRTAVEVRRTAAEADMVGNPAPELFPA